MAFSFNDLFGTSQQQQQQQQQQFSTTNTQPTGQQPQILSPKSKRVVVTNQASIKLTSEQVVPFQTADVDTSKEAGGVKFANEKLVKAYEFLKDDSSEAALKSSRVDKSKEQLEAIKEDGRMQAYGWSLPYKNSIKTSNSGDSAAATTSSSPVLNISVPVPVYCRPLFQKENQAEFDLKLSCASTLNFLFDYKNLADLEYANVIETSRLNCFQSQEQITEQLRMDVFKSSCIWICNFNDIDTHVSILDANKPSDLIKQFTLKTIKIHCLLSVHGAFKGDMECEKPNVKGLVGSTTKAVSKAHKSSSSEAGSEEASAAAGAAANETNELDNITYIEFEAATESLAAGDMEPTNVSTRYPTMWLGSQEGMYVVVGVDNNHRFLFFLRV
jgi:hypothetical protein